MDNVSVIEYDPACEDLHVASRAILHLVRRAKWNLLEQLGIGREHRERLIDATLDGVPKTDAETDLVVALCPIVKDAARKAVIRYVEVTAPGRLRKVLQHVG